MALQERKKAAGEIRWEAVLVAVRLAMEMVLASQAFHN
jgi:hypothetical protein